MNELRVAIFTGNYNHIADGVSLTLNRLVAFLNKKQIPVIVFGPTTREPEIDHEGDFVPVPSFPLPLRTDYRWTMGMSQEAKKRLDEFKPTLIDIVTPDWLGYQAVRYARRRKIPVVANYHTHFTSYLKYYHIDMLESPMWKYLSWFYSQCKHIYVPTVSMMDILSEHGIEKGLRIWTRGVDSDLFHPDKRNMEWRRKQDIRDDEILVTFVSRLVWEKDLQTLAATMSKVNESDNNIKFMVVGDGPAREELESMMPGAFFTGFLKGKELARAYASSDIFFFPSESETFGSVTLEALSSGIPAVVANATGSSSIVDSGVDGYIIPPKNAEKFAEAIVKLAMNPELREKMSKNAREKSLDYSWDRILKGLVENYCEALQSNGSGH